MTEQKDKKREAPISYRPPSALREEFYTRVEKSGMTINAFITKCCLGVNPGRQSRRPSKDMRDLARQLAHEAKNTDILRALLDLDDLPEHLISAIEESLNRSLEIRASIFKFMGRKP